MGRKGTKTAVSGEEKVTSQTQTGRIEKGIREKVAKK